MRLGVYVGSFNPVHNGHIYIIDFLLNNNYLDKVIVIPTGDYWDKKDLIDIQDRINMLKFFESDRVIINDTLNNKPYTYEIMNILKEEYKEDELYLIIGADNIFKFHLWKNVSDILKNKVIVLNRDNIKVSDYVNKYKERDNFIIINDFKCIDISSTNIRKNIEKSKESLDNKVYEYIIHNNLYRS